VTFAANVIRVLIASPSDTAELRAAVERALHEWNGDRAAASSVILLPRRWETNAVPELTGEDGQSVINRQLVDEADIVIGIFHSKLGQATPRYASGTAEELHEAKNAGKRVHVYFSSMPIDRKHVDPEALETLEKFKKEIEKIGLYGSFDTPGSLRDQVRRAVEVDILALELGSPAVGTEPAPRGASLRAVYQSSREPDGKGRMQTRRQRITITNTGETDASDIVFRLEPTGNEEGLEAPHLFDEPPPFTLVANGGEVSFPIMTHMGTANTATISFSWSENGEPKTSAHTVSFI